LQNTPLHPLAEAGRQRFGDASVSDKGRPKDKKRRFVMLSILNAAAATIAFNLGLVAMGLLPRHQALRLGRMLVRKYPRQGQ
jgi:hypothetical protein